MYGKQDSSKKMTIKFYRLAMPFPPVGASVWRKTPPVESAYHNTAPIVNIDIMKVWNRIHSCKSNDSKGIFFAFSVVLLWEGV